MTILLIAAWVVVVSFMGYRGSTRGKRAVARKKPRILESGLSWPAKQILKEYNKLPVDSRPFNDITTMLAALDIKHGGVEKVNNHYRDGYSYTVMRWDACDKCRYPSLYGVCTRFKQYTELRKVVRGVADEVAKQNQAMAVANVQHDLDAIQTLTERLREEKAIISAVTKELL